MALSVAGDRGGSRRFTSLTPSSAVKWGFRLKAGLQTDRRTQGYFQLQTNLPDCIHEATKATWP